MPGTVTQVAVREGDSVAAGQAIAVVEAMKMEHVIRAPQAGRVVALRVRAGDQVNAGAIVAELQSSGAPADEPEAASS
jgi:biotin carboxyl carrier protein